MTSGVHAERHAPSEGRDFLSRAVYRMDTQWAARERA